VQGIITLAAVIVGALIAGGLDFFFEARREKADLRQAKRLVGDEIQTIWVNLTALADARTAPTYPLGAETADAFLPTIAWEANKTTLARHLSDDDWEELPVLMHAATRLRLMYAKGQAGRVLSNEEVEQCEDLAQTASTLYKTLTGRDVWPE
jgi:hypothetical protein